MLTHLRIRDYALIDDLTIDLRPGLTVLTGETGAGKSIVVGALSLLLGEKPDPDMVRSGADSATVEGRFDGVGGAAAACRELGIDLADGSLILRRRTERAGRGAIHANDSGITVSGLQAVADLLVDLHGQHRHQYLLRPQVHLELLDAFAGQTDQRRRLAELFAEHAATAAELARLEAELARRRQQRELTEFQWKELADTGVRTGLVAELNAERELLQSSERRHALAARLAELLSEQDGSVSELLAAASKALGELADLDPRLAGRRDALAAAESAVGDLWRETLGYRDGGDFSPERLEEINGRLYAIEKLERKHGTAADELPALAERLRRELDSLELDESRIPELRAQTGTLHGQLCAAAAAISKKRHRAKTEMEKRLGTELAELGLGSARFAVELSRAEDPQGACEEQGRRCSLTASGFDLCEFLFSANPGEELRPLRKVVSGGELSRIMLGLKTVLAQVDPVPTLVFDEIDAGIGGRVAEAVGRRLALLGREHQVICITHLPQIARHGDDHLLVTKTTRAGRTVSGLRRLDEGERVAELARMGGGERTTETGLAHAREMLQAARRAAPRRR